MIQAVENRDELGVVEINVVWNWRSAASSLRRLMLLLHFGTMLKRLQASDRYAHHYKRDTMSALA